METFNNELFVATLALVGAVILVSALLSGLIERSGLPQVAVFLALGAVIGPAGLNLLTLTLDSPIIRVVATLSLVLVLFNDAVGLDIAEVRRHTTLALLVLGPGTLLSALLIGIMGWGLLGLAPAAAAVLAAALASTDPVLLRGLLRRPDVPAPARQALRLESGLNDVVLLPIVLVAMVFLGSGTDKSGGLDAVGWAKMVLELFILGPGAGVLIGLLAVATLDLVRNRIGIQRNYESLYAIGVAFTAYAAAEALHGSGFLAAFAAGMTISALDVELCDCFLEYGETTAEMALLFTFVLFGGSLIWVGLANLSLSVVLFTFLVIAIRPVVYLLALARTKISRRSRLIIAWFGPRGLSSMLLVLLAVFAKLPGSEALFSVCCLVVLVSVVLHGFSPMFIGGKPKGNQKAPANPSASPQQMEITVVNPVANGHTALASPVTAPPHKSLTVIQPPPPVPKNGEEADYQTFPTVPELITMDELKQLWQQQENVLVLDVRTERSYSISNSVAEGAIRLLPDLPVKEAQKLNLPKNAWLIAFCA